MLESGSRTDVGKVRKNNEDSFFVKDGQGLYIVADGMGGHAGGEVASQMTVDSISRSWDENVGKYRKEDVPRLAAEAIAKANRSVFERGSKHAELRGMGTTVVVVNIEPQVAFISHVGDSRCYLLRNDELRQITIDHQTPNGYLIRAIGMKKDVHIDTTSFHLQKNDLLLLCSDGLTNMLLDEDIEKVLKKKWENLDDACEELIGEANKAGGIDNITVVLVRIPTVAKKVEKSLVNFSINHPGFVVYIKK